MNNNLDQQITKTKKLSPILLLSGLFVAISYVVLLIPFAIYSIAQVSAMLGKRFGLLVMLAVCLALFILSVLSESSLLISAAVLLFASIPFFVIAITLREKLFPKSVAIIVLLTPLILGFCSFVFLPVLNSSQFDNVISQLEGNIISRKHEVQKQIETNVSASPKTQLVGKYDEALSQLQTLSSLKELREFMSYNAWQRMVWFVVGSGSIFFFFALLVSFANVIFLDLAFEQVEKVRAIIAYVLKNASSFSSEFVLAISQIPIRSSVTKKQESFFIVKHETNSNAQLQNQMQNVKVIRLSLFKNLNHSNRVLLRGYSFLYEGNLFSWNLKKFSLPLPVVAFSLAFMAVLLFWFGSSEELITSLATNHNAAYIAMGCVLAFAVLSILTLQGLFTFYMRVSNFAGFLFLLFLFILGSSFSIGYYAILAIFGSIALLDYVYDWRRKKLR